MKIHTNIKESSFTAKSKESGKVVNFASKQNRDNAIKSGEYEETDDVTKDTAPAKPRVNIFDKPASKSDKDKDGKTDSDKSDKWGDYQEPDWIKNAKPGWDSEKVKNKSAWGDEPMQEPDWIKNAKPGWNTKPSPGDAPRNAAPPIGKKVGAVPPPPPPPPTGTKKAGAVPPPPPPPPPPSPMKPTPVVKTPVDVLKSKVEKWSDKEKAFFRDGIHKQDSPERRNWKDAIRDKAKGAIAAIKKGAKHEVEEFKTAGAAVKNFFSGKELSEHEKKALKAVAIKVATTAIFGAVTGGAGHGALAFGKHVAMEFIPHVVGETILKGAGSAALFAGDEDADAEMERFMQIIADKMASEKITPELMTQMVDSYNAKKGEGDSVNELTHNEKSIRDGNPNNVYYAFYKGQFEAIYSSMGPSGLFDMYWDKFKVRRQAGSKFKLNPEFVLISKKDYDNSTSNRYAKLKPHVDKLWDTLKNESINEEIRELTPDQSEMVQGIIDMLLQIKDIDNRMEVAQQQIQNFKDEEIVFNYAWFLSAAGLDNNDEPVRMDVKTQPQHIINKESIMIGKINEDFKHIIHVDTPTQVVSKPVAAQILALAKKGIRSKDIGLEMGFVGNAKLATDAFQKVKNKIYFELGNKNESVNEVASRTAMEIGGLTGMNKDAIQKFVDEHNLDIEKVFEFVKKGKLPARMDFMTAVVGKPGNPIQKKIIKMFSESVNEGSHGMATKLLQSIVSGDSSRAEGTKMSKELAQHYIDWIRTSPFGKKNGNLPLDMLVKASFNWGIERGLDSKLKGELSKLKSTIKESVNEVKYPTDLKVGSVILGQGFTMLKGIEGGKYYKVVSMDDTTATLTLSDKIGNTKGSTKVRHKLDSIEGGIKTAKRGDENGIVVIKESVNEEDTKSPEETLASLKQMAMGDLERIEDYAEMISDRMKEGQELSAWMYSQITLAVDQLNAVHDTMDGKDGVKESVNEEEIKWNAVENAIINFLKANTKILDKRVKDRDIDGVKGGLKSIISGLTNAQRSLKLESVNEASTPGEQIQNLNNRLTKLRQDMAKAKSPEAKNVIQARMKNALQKLSDKKKDMGIKKP